MSEKKDLTGLRFMHLLVLEDAGTNKYGRAKWLCKCDCGNYHTTLGKYLLNGDATSCGCRRAKFLVNVTYRKQPVHGMSNTRIFQTWQGMRNRCNNPNDRAYRNYGGRGIKICKEWNDFMNFYHWAMANGYTDDLTIDRINNDGNYEPSNCRWADLKTQANNTRRNHYLTYKGKTKSMAEWADEKNIEYSTLRARINTYHWPVEKAIETPVRKFKRRETNE